MNETIINLTAGNPDLPPHASVIETLNRESQRSDVHTSNKREKGSPVLRTAISDWYKQWYNVSLDAGKEVLPLIGSKQGIVHVCMAYLKKGDKALVPDPGYPVYNNAVELPGADVLRYKLTARNNWYPDLKKLRKKNLKNVKLMFLNYPHSPTGQLPDYDVLADCIAFAKEHDILICHDNAYSFFSNARPFSLLSMSKENVIELNTLSKSHNMSGWRVGMLCGASKRIDEVFAVKSTMDSGMFLPVQLAAAQALRLGKEWFDHMQEIYSCRRQKIYALLDMLECKYEPERGGLYVWAEVPKKMQDGYRFSEWLLNGFNIFVLPGGAFGKAGTNYVRIGLCVADAQIDECLERLRNFKCETIPPKKLTER